MDKKLLEIAKSLSSSDMKKVRVYQKNMEKIDALKVEELELEKKLVKVRRQLARLTGEPLPPRPAGGGRRGRASGKKSLADYAVEVLAAVGEPMKLAQIAEGVVEAGYVSRSQNLAPMLTTALSKREEVLKVGRGLYKTEKPFEKKTVLRKSEEED